MSENYLAAISNTELARLEMQHSAWKPATDGFLRKADFPNFKNIIEFGCGPGLVTTDLTREISPQAKICAADISELYLQHLTDKIQSEKLSNVRTLRANLTTQLELDSDFDGAFCRWFLAWIYRDLDAVLRNIFNSLKSGGTFAMMEYLTLKTTVSSPPNPAFDRMTLAWEEFYLQCGGTTEIGAILPDALTKAGFKIKSIECAGGLAPSNHPLFNWWKRLNEDFNEIFIEKKLLTSKQDLELKNFWETNSKNPNAFIYTPIVAQIAAVKP